MMSRTYEKHEKHENYIYHRIKTKNNKHCILLYSVFVTNKRICTCEYNVQHCNGSAKLKRCF